ncbi:hypothetical protein BpOF4_21804 (plasmid) [Alkalihalophilus pseudofirmus OF4]|uniref:Uncharacterized protein n=1 Tax=Alkalihalophilus pseudofirmus (strain ATCC BAA-2126 / JCM 17055 / OF4) TaxID=398511 RepID=D3G1Y0_ALKPO|nr:MULTISPECIES: hypothetical protein [Alkalihalophilus]ADC52356.1 hypothetical protein BpOF4_21804 [Alkalihalophilus pseudofirmus OF4]MED1602981.1 hypothetical protein [Alkalihalophilus marmarensis]
MKRILPTLTLLGTLIVISAVAATNENTYIYAGKGEFAPIAIVKTFDLPFEH